MTTLLLTHEVFADHVTPDGHPERPDRIRALHQLFASEHFDALKREEAPMGRIEDVERAHPRDYIEMIRGSVPDEGQVPLDPDTWLSATSWEPVMRSVGAGIRAVDAVLAGEVDNAFCAVRPPGHHAETERPMGFCVFNSVAIAAYYARAVHGLERVAVVDFDVHHGNGTQAIFWNDEDMLYASTHQMPLFPGTGSRSETGVGNVFNAPLSPGAGGEAMREAMETVVLPAVDNFGPDLILVSAGFDAHRKDPLASLTLVEEDFAWISLKLVELAVERCDGRLVSMLEGGYDLGALAASCGIHVQALMQG